MEFVSVVKTAAIGGIFFSWVKFTSAALKIALAYHFIKT